MFDVFDDVADGLEVFRVIVTTPAVKRQCSNRSCSPFLKTGCLPGRLTPSGWLPSIGSGTYSQRQKILNVQTCGAGAPAGRLRTTSTK
jgi:hypothetical protein